MYGQEHVHALRDIWGLQGFEVREVEIEDGRNRKVKVVRLRDLRGEHRCPCCGRAHREVAFQESEPRRWRDNSLGDFVTFVEIEPWRVVCCGGTHVESFPWEAPGHRMTRRLFERIASFCTRLPVREVARLHGLSWDTVARVDKTATRMAIGPEGPNLDGLRWIGVDEVSRTGGHVYFTVVTDLKAGSVVWIGEGKGEETLAAFFQILGKKRCRRIRGVVSDLSAAYLAAIAAAIPQAIPMLDGFHIIQWLNEALNDVRRQAFGGAPRDDLGRTLKVKKWLLLRAREALTLGQKQLLGRLLHRNRTLQRAYVLKEQLRGIFHFPWVYLGALRRALGTWCRMAIRSRLKPLARIGYRIRENLEKIIVGFEHPIRQGLVEAINGKIAFLRRQARGYRDPEYFKLKIIQRCSLSENPYAQMVL